MLTIGSPVLVSAVTNLQYQERDRVPVRCPTEPFRAVITGKVRRMLGTYKTGHRADGYDEPPCLDVNGSVALWTVRTSLFGAEILVADADLVFCPPFQLPSTSRKPTYVNEDREWFLARTNVIACRD